MSKGDGRREWKEEEKSVIDQHTCFFCHIVILSELGAGGSINHSFWDRVSCLKR